MNDLELRTIKKIIINNNFIDEFQSLEKYKEAIAIIEIKGNIISKIDYLKNFADECKNLKRISLNENEIN